MKYMDFHADTLTEIKSKTLQENSNNVDLKRVSQVCSSYIQVFALWKDKIQVKDTEREFEQLYQRAISLLKQEENRIALCISFKDLENAARENKSAAFLSIEDISLMGRHAEQVKELGFRFAMLTWNYENEYAFGAEADQAKGLKPAGRKLLKRLTKAGIIVDISHLSDAGAEDVFELTKGPVIASHSNIRDVCPHPRNLNREQVREIIRRKGIIGLNLYRPFVAEGASVTIQDLFRHMDYILNIGGEDVLAFGMDFDGCDGLFPEEVQGVESVPYIREQMERAGFGEALLEKLFFENGYRFLKENL